MSHVMRGMRRYFFNGRHIFLERHGKSSGKIQIPEIFQDSTTSEQYANQRHSYSEELFKCISDYCRETTRDLNLAVDVGCGPGNSTVGFTKYFKQVIGVDISESQIAVTPKNIPNCQFRVGNAANLEFLDDASVDLFACGLAFNLMPKTEVLAEAERVLRPGGTLAIFGHGRFCCTDMDVDAIVEPMYDTAMRTSVEVKEVTELFPDLQLPYPGWIRKSDMIISQPMKKDGIIGLARLLHRFMLTSGHNDTAFVKSVDQQLVNLFDKRGWNPHTQAFEMRFKAVILLGHKPN